MSKDQLREFSDFIEHGEVEPETQDFLEHYGVAGMKWGVRKATVKSQSRAFRKASKKAKRLQKRSNRLAVKGARMVLRATKRKRHDKYMKGLRLQLKSAKIEKKADVWENAMREAFRDVSLSSIDEKSLDKGRAFIYMLANT